MRHPRSFPLAVLAAAAALTIAACGDDGGTSADPTVRVSEAEFSLEPAASKVPSGQITFDVADQGEIDHEFVVIRTDKRAVDLLKGREADETGAVDEIEDIKPGATKRLTPNLKPGHYALICNLPGHYIHNGKPGMLADFNVS